MAYTKLRPRRGTLYEWTTINPVPEEGELVVEIPDTGVGTGLSKFKIGDGTRAYNQLPYAFNGAAAAAINGGDPTNFSVIQLRSASRATWKAVNPVLAENELVYDTTLHGFKIGDGTSPWNDLDYLEFASEWAINSTGTGYDSVYEFGDEDGTSDQGTILSAAVNPTEVYAASGKSGNRDYYEDNILPDGWDDHINTDHGADTDTDDGGDEDTPTVGLSDLVN